MRRIFVLLAMVLCACGVDRGVELPERTYPIATSGTTIWLNRDGVLAALDTRDGSVDVFDDLPVGLGVEGLVRGGELWVSDWKADVIRRIDLRTKRMLDPVTATKPLVMADDGRNVWFTSVGGTLFRTDASLRAVPVALDVPVCEVAVADRRVWVVSAEAQRVLSLSTETGAVQTEDAIPQPVCAFAANERGLFVAASSGKAIVTLDRESGELDDWRWVRPPAERNADIPSTADTLIPDRRTLWSRSPQGIFEFDPTKGAVTLTVLASQPYAPVVLADGSVWLFVERYARAIR